ncbi:hypothetical protein CPB84DRAFT_1753948 [Gymnopilus junonius]|uniref:Uncharacterized protein n=1 Tax=Gymnopilus junonius TaxID=109634 RepID=A0A9P5N782_GYMJU|nr:hypothetical protein CPB84DRAFT_1753948 [Gymnopilus junonius]
MDITHSSSRPGEGDVDMANGSSSTTDDGLTLDLWVVVEEFLHNQQTIKKSNELLASFGKQLNDIAERMAKIQCTAEIAEDQATKAEKALEQQRLNSERQLHDLESSLKEDASNKILLAEKRAQTMLKDIQGLGLGICLPTFHDHHRTDSHSSANGSAMIIDEQETHPPVNKGKQHAKGKSSEIELPSILSRFKLLPPPVPPTFSPSTPPPQHLHSKIPTKQASRTTSPIPKPAYFNWPKSNGDSVHFKCDIGGSNDDDGDSSDNSDSGEDMHHSKPPQLNISELNGEELLKFLLTTFEFKDPAKKIVRQKEKTDFMNWLCKHLHHLLGIGKMRQILKLTDEIYATNTELQQSMTLWESNKIGEGPQLEPMKVNWNNFEGQWNIKLCELFVQSCIDKGLGEGSPTDSVKEFVTNYFWDHLEHIRAVIRKNKPKADEDPETHSARTKEWHLEALIISREKSVTEVIHFLQIFKDRLDICLDNLPKKVNEIVTTQQQAWKTKYDIIQALGPEGMSSDESDTDSDTKTYIVKKVIALGFIKKRKLKEVCHTKAPTRKPVDLYDPDWYEKLKDWKKIALKAKPALNY